MYTVRLDCMLSCDNLIDLSSKSNHFSCYCFAISACVFFWCCGSSISICQYRFPYAFERHKQILETWIGRLKLNAFFSTFDIMMWPDKMHQFQSHCRVFAWLLCGRMFHLDVMSFTTFCVRVRCHVCTLIFIYTFIIKIESLE